jgi:diguanylate cyclase (GGDEF)-like protein/PAS domain S-box-containing protein
MSVAGKPTSKKKRRISEASVRRALLAGDFVPYFQPIVTMSSGQLAGLEVLARWQHEEHGFIAPNAFIPHAERNGWIYQLTEQLLLKALTAAREIPEHLSLSVNASPIQLRGSLLPKIFFDAFAKTGYPPERLVVEITESALIENLASALKTVKELKAMGCKLSLDDFGTGYSSLSHLHALPFDELKIDRSFVSSEVEGQSSRKIVGAIIGLGHSLGLRTVAEGIETEEHADVVRALGCDLGQGWLYGKPVAAEDLASVVAATRPVPTAKSRSSPVTLSHPHVSDASFEGARAFAMALVPSLPDPPRSEIVVSTNAMSTPGHKESDYALASLRNEMVANPDNVVAELLGSGWSSMRHVFDSVMNGITLADMSSPEMPVIYVNPAFERMTGYLLDEVRGRNCRFLQADDRAQCGVKLIREGIKESRDVRALLKNYGKDGTPFWNELFLSPIHNRGGKLTHYVGIQNNVTVKVELEAKLAHMAKHDILTGLPNRGLLMDRISRALMRAERTQQNVAVLFFDLNKFKEVNDTFGHDAGDTLLKSVSYRLTSLLRMHDTAARLGGDEFVVVLEDLNGEEDATAIRARLNHAIREPIWISQGSLTASASIGMALYPRDGKTPEELLQAADMAMYLDKAAISASLAHLQINDRLAIGG